MEPHSLFDHLESYHACSIISFRFFCSFEWNRKNDCIVRQTMISVDITTAWELNLAENTVTLSVKYQTILLLLSPPFELRPDKREGKNNFFFSGWNQSSKFSIICSKYIMSLKFLPTVGQFVTHCLSLAHVETSDHNTRQQFERNVKRCEWRCDRSIHASLEIVKVSRNVRNEGNENHSIDYLPFVESLFMKF